MRILDTVRDLVWAGLMTVMLLIVGFFVLRVVQNVAKNTPLNPFVSRIQHAATPSGA